MKYLFFFNGQPFLLCCVCCKIAIQDFLKGLHKKNKKNLRFHRRVYRRTITRRYFTESCKNIYGIVPHSPTAFPTANTDGSLHIPKRTHVWHVSICTNTDGFADVKYRWNHRRIVAHPEAHACLTRVRLHEYRRLCRRQIPTESPMAYACLTRVRLHEYRRIFQRICRRIEKFGGIFELFWCVFQLIADGITDGI